MDQKRARGHRDERQGQIFHLRKFGFPNSHFVAFLQNFQTPGQENIPCRYTSDSAFASKPRYHALLATTHVSGFGEAHRQSKSSEERKPERVHA